ncbi:hypothetical protein FOZ61_009997 [Perkinsus olseni]|uniref:Uncharacterized protein n=1 Tax=Perkinsus olseni TaxID=32597 RepID=A0A7J6KXD8_PEROL|nr:hypothetical protein FOZ61_009997 [Perkinsus olseni]
MVENPSSEPSVNPVGLQIAQAFGVENVYLLRHVTDEEFSKKCEEMLSEKKKTFADILAWRDYMEDIKNPRPQLYVVTARIVDTVSKLPLPDGEAYNGFQDKRSISWFVKEIQGTSKLFQLSCRAEWLFLTNACKPLVRSAMLKQVECNCGDEVWMHDYDQMLAVAEDYLTTKYRRSDDPSRYEARIINVRQRSAESVYAYLDRVTELVSQGQNCGLQLSPEQVCSAFRLGLLGRLRKTANVQFSTVTRASTLASELTRFSELNPWVLESSSTDRVETALIAAGLVLSTDVMKKTFSTASDELVATRQVTMCLILLDAKSTEFMLYWQPYVIDTGLPGCDGLFGRDILQWGDTGLEVLTTDGLLSISKFLCTADELKCCQSTYRIDEDLLLPPDDNLVCDRDAMGPVDDDNDDTGTITSCADNVDPKLLKVNRLEVETVLILIPYHYFCLINRPLLLLLNQHDIVIGPGCDLTRGS